MSMLGKDITDLEREDGIGDRKRFLLTFDGEDDPRPDIFRMAKDQNWVLWELRESELKLQDVFQALTQTQVLLVARSTKCFCLGTGLHS